jgi:hypothetical protein
MNKRILELAEQCRNEIYGVNGELLAADFDEQKFAELIVRECIKATGNCAGTGDMIKEHFGVE